MSEDKWGEFCCWLWIVIGIMLFSELLLADMYTLATKGTIWQHGSVQFLDKTPLVNYLELWLDMVLLAFTAALGSLMCTFVIWFVGWCVIGLAMVIAKASEEQPETSC
jgi:heme/copper-type cytochrome/quinol oxidase subunit 3